jgi:hypothetical protein
MKMNTADNEIQEYIFSISVSFKTLFKGTHFSLYKIIYLFIKFVI